MLNQSRPNYDFSARPAAVDANRLRYRDPYGGEPQIIPQNIMHDPRVVRGNTYAAIVIPASHQQENLRLQKEQKERLRRKQMQQRQELENNEMERMMAEEELQHEHDEMGMGAEVEIEGRESMEEPQDEEWIELDGQDVEHETLHDYDFFVNRPETPTFIPNKEGEDKETQIEEGELFDYDLEVEPILQVLVGKTLEQSRIEVLEEHEQSLMNGHRREWEQLREAELMETQRMEAAYKRGQQEKERRNLQQKLRKEVRRSAHQKVVCRLLSKAYLASLKDRSLRLLQDHGFLRDPVESEIFADYLPWIYNETTTNCNQDVDSQEFLDKLVQLSIQVLSGEHRDAIEKEKERRKEVQRQEEERLRQLEIEKQRRREERARKREEARLAALKQRIIDELVNEGATREPLDGQDLTDIENHWSRDPVIAVLGGLFGQFVIALSHVDNNMSTDKIETLLKKWLSAIKQSTLNLPISEEGIEALETIGVNLSTRSTIQELEEEKWHDVRELTGQENFLGTLPLRRLRNREQLIEPRVLEAVIMGLFSILRFKPTEDQEDDPLKQKINLHKVPARKEEEIEEIAVLEIKNAMEAIPDSERSVLNDSKLGDKSMDKSSEKDVEESEKPSGENTADQSLVSEVPMRERQPKPEDKIQAVRSRNAEIAIFVVHRPAQKLILRQILTFFKDNHFPARSMDVEEKAREIEEDMKLIEKEIMDELIGEKKVDYFDIEHDF